MNPWMKLAGAIATSLYADHRAKTRLADSLESEERVLRQVSATLLNSIFDKSTGYLSITTDTLRFEKTMTMTGHATKGSVVIPLDAIRRVTVEKYGLFNGKIVLDTAGGRREFVVGMAVGTELKDLIFHVRGW